MHKSKIDYLKESLPTGSIIILDSSSRTLSVAPGTQGTVINVDDNGLVKCRWTNGVESILDPDQDIIKLSSSEPNAKALTLKSGYYYEFSFNGGYNKSGIVLEYASISSLPVYRKIKAIINMDSPGYAIVDNYGDLHIINPLTAKMKKADENIKLLLRKTAKFYKEYYTTYCKYMKACEQAQQGIISIGSHPVEYYAAETYRMTTELKALKEEWHNNPYAGT